MTLDLLDAEHEARELLSLRDRLDAEHAAHLAEIHAHKETKAEVERLRAERDSALERAAVVADEWGAQYPLEVFGDGDSIESKAAAHGRRVAGLIAKDIRELALSPSGRGGAAALDEARAVGFRQGVEAACAALPCEVSAECRCPEACAPCESCASEDRIRRALAAPTQAPPAADQK